MNKVTEQLAAWTTEFGQAYTDRNFHSPADQAFLLQKASAATPARPAL